MSLPTRDEIYDEAMKLFMSDNPGAPVPEEEELKEGNYWLRARDGLMRGYRGELESALGMYEVEVEKIREALGIAPPPERVELEARLDTITTSFETTRGRLKSAREEIKRLERELEEARKPPPPPEEPRFVTVQDVVDYSVDAALTHIAEDYIRLNARRIYQSQGRGPARDFLKEQIRNWGFMGPGMPFVKGTPTGIEVDYADEVYTTTYNELLNRALDPGYRLAYRHVPEVEVPPPEVAAKFKPGDKVRYKGTVTSIEGVRGPPWTYTLGREVGRVSGIPENELELVVVGVPPVAVPAIPPEKPLVEAPPLIEMGLQKADEVSFRDFFLTKLMEGTFGHSAARGHLPEFRILLGDLRKEWRNYPRERAVVEAKSDVEVLVDKIIARKPPRVAPPPYRRAPPAVIRVELPEEKPREPTYETRYCWIGDEAFTHDVDLEMRLRKAVMRGRFAADVAALDLPERFYHLCSEHKMEKYSYFSMIDAVAYRLADRSKQNIGFTVTTLRGLGLTPDDISSIVLRAGEYGYKHQSSSSSSSYAVP